MKNKISLGEKGQSWNIFSKSSCWAKLIVKALVLTEWNDVLQVAVRIWLEYGTTIFIRPNCSDWAILCRMLEVDPEVPTLLLVVVDKLRESLQCHHLHRRIRP